MQRVEVRRYIKRTLRAAGARAGMRYEATLTRGGRVVGRRLGAAALYQEAEPGDACEVAVYRRERKRWVHALDVRFVIGASERPMVTQYAAPAALREELARLAHHMRSAATVTTCNAEFIEAVAADVAGEAGEAIEEAAERVAEAAEELARMSKRASGDATGKKGVPGEHPKSGD